MDILNIEDLEELVKKEYFTSLAISKHGEINRPAKLCEIKNPRLRIVEFEKQGNTVNFKYNLCYLFQNAVLNEMNFAVLYGFDRYKKNNVYIKEIAREIILNMFEEYPNIKVYDYETPPIDLILTSSKDEYLPSLDANSSNFLLDKYGISFNISDIKYTGDIGNLQTSLKILPKLMIKYLTVILDERDSEEKDKLKEILLSQGFLLPGKLPLSLSDKTVQDLSRNNFYLQAYKMDGGIYVDGIFPVIPLYRIVNKIKPEILQDIKTETKKGCILKTGKYILPYDEVQELENTTLQDIIKKYEFLYDIIYVFSCKYSEYEVDIKESTENPREFSVPKAEKGEKRKKYFFI
jgi:hypothetical protein